MLKQRGEIAASRFLDPLMGQLQIVLEKNPVITGAKYGAKHAKYYSDRHVHLRLVY